MSADALGVLLRSGSTKEPLQMFVLFKTMGEVEPGRCAADRFQTRRHLFSGSTNPLQFFIFGSVDRSACRFELASPFNSFSEFAISLDEPYPALPKAFPFFLEVNRADRLVSQALSERSVEAGPIAISGGAFFYFRASSPSEKINQINHVKNNK